ISASSISISTSHQSVTARKPSRYNTPIIYIMYSCLLFAGRNTYHSPFNATRCQYQWPVIFLVYNPGFESPASTRFYETHTSSPPAVEPKQLVGIPQADGQLVLVSYPR